MNVDKQAIDTLKSLQRSFKEEGLGALRLSSEDIVTDIVKMASRSANADTRKLALTALEQIEFQGRSITIDGKTFMIANLSAENKPGDSDSFDENPSEKHSNITYRGQHITTSKSSESEKTSKKPRRTYRGQRIS